jgi:hypothetical protein
MIDERTLRRALWFSAFYNLSGTFLFAFPHSFAGRLAGLPSSVPALYAAMLGYFVLLFAGTYLWLALQREIVRPILRRPRSERPAHSSLSPRAGCLVRWAAVP